MRNCGEIILNIYTIIELILVEISLASSPRMADFFRLFTSCYPPFCTEMHIQAQFRGIA